ncbi:MAG: hypothetical protein CMJ64_13865, partial [Planctomycetaceae bacterium]|nr:hypothetical protein [Planctomycetaceae bacterium]
LATSLVSDNVGENNEQQACRNEQMHHKCQCSRLGSTGRDSSHAHSAVSLDSSTPVQVAEVARLWQTDPNSGEIKGPAYNVPFPIRVPAT